MIHCLDPNPIRATRITIANLQNTSILSVCTKHKILWRPKYFWKIIVKPYWNLIIMLSVVKLILLLHFFLYSIHYNCSSFKVTYSSWDVKADAGSCDFTTLIQFPNTGLSLCITKTFLVRNAYFFDFTVSLSDICFKKSVPGPPQLAPYRRLQGFREFCIIFLSLKCSRKLRSTTTFLS